MKHLFTLSTLLIGLSTAAQTWTDCVGSTAGTQINSFLKHGSTLFASSPYYGIYSSTDNGANFAEITNNIADFAGVGALLTDGTNLYAIGHDTYKSTDGGVNWTSVGDISTYNVNDAIYHDGAIYIASNADVWKSVDGGVTYVAKGTTEFVNGNVLDIMVHNNNLYVTTSASGVYKSTDAGETWTAIDGNLPDGTQTNRIEAIGNTLYYAEYTVGVYKSTDDGATWTVVSAAPVSTTSMLVVGSTLLLGRSGNVLYSTDGGATFTNTVLPISFPIVLRMYASGSFLYAGTNNSGAYRTDAAFLGTSGLEEEKRAAVSAYPNPANDFVTVSFPEGGASEINLTDCLGNTVISQKVVGLTSQISTCDLPEGIYFLKTDNGHSATCIVVAHH